MINIDFEKDFIKLQKNLGDLKSKQIPFAVTIALNEMAKKAKPTIQDEFSRKLEIKNKGLMKFGIGIDWAKKNDWPFISSTVGIREEVGFLSDHVLGATRASKSTRGKAIPTSLVKRSASGRVMNSLRPMMILKKKGHFMINSKKDGRALIMKRTTKDRYPIEVVYGFSPKVKIESRMDLDKYLNQVFSSGAMKFDTLFGKALAKAIRTSKK